MRDFALRRCEMTRQNDWLGALAVVLMLVTCDAGRLLGRRTSLVRRKSVPTVTIASGKLAGIHLGQGEDSAAFLGIPYAAPPIRGLRWKPPQPVAPWSGIRNAEEFGAACTQLPARWLPNISWSEDCLYLNVWTPHLSPGSKLPVLVYFHGGSNTQGYSQMTALGPALSRYGVVVVSANYRLGPFGFLALAALTDESEHHCSGNYGLLDQLEALKWVHDNIAQFGGDRGRVTAIGQSAGAVDICLLMSSPLAAGLFQRAILESGDCQSTFNEDIRTPIPYNLISGTGEANGERLARDLGASGPGALRKLRGIAADEILKAWSNDRELQFDAIVDGWVVPEQPAKIFAGKKQMHIPVLVGSNADEATVFGLNPVKTVDQYKNYLRQDTGQYSAREFQIYPVSGDAEVPGQYLRFESDSFAYGAYSLAQAVTRAGQNAYLYYFTFSETGKRASLGAYHGEELNFLSDTFPADWQPSPEDQKIGEEIRTYWTQFAKTGDPNTADLPHWAAYDDGSRDVFELGRRIGPRPVAPRIQQMENLMLEVLGTPRESPSSAPAVR